MKSTRIPYHLLILTSSLGLGSFAQAQPVNEPADVKPKYSVEPRVTAGITVSNNGGLDTTIPQGDQFFRLSPGVRAVMNTAKVTGFLDYSLTALYVAQDTAGDNIRHYLNADATIRVLDDRFFVDLSGVVEDQNISAFGTPGVGSWADVNKSETATFGFSPYLKGRFSGDAEYELRYRTLSLATEDETSSDINLNQVSFRATSPAGGQRFGWMAGFNRQVVDYSLGRQTTSDVVEGGVSFRVLPQLLMSLSAGVERNNFVTVERKQYTNTDLSMEWRPSERTKIAAGIQRRYFGSGHNINLEHRTSRTIWRYVDTRAASYDALASGAASLGSIYELLDALYAATETDDVLRDRLVRNKLNELGLADDTQVFQEYLTSAAILRRFQRISVAWVGARDVLTFALSRTDSRRLDTVVALGVLGDDFDANTRVKQIAWSIDYGHRLTPLSALNVTYSSQKNVGDGVAQLARLHSVTVGLSTRLGRRTDGALQLRHSVSNGTATPYKETSVAGYITHRF